MIEKKLPGHCALIINPTAGRYTPGTVEEVVAALKRRGFAPEIFLTREAEDAGRFARRLCLEHDAPLIVAGGGDGTINGVLNGLVPGKASLGVLPLGTANVLAAELGIASMEDAVERVAAGRTRPLPVGMLEGDGEPRYFFLMAGIGFDGEVVAGVRLGEKRWLKHGAYLLSALRVLCRWEKESVELLADGRSIRCHTAVLCNAARYGGRYILAPAADIFTPGFQVVCVTGKGRTAYLRLAARLAAGKGAAARDVTVVSAREVTVAGRKPVQVDGDFWGYTPVTVRVVEEFVRLLV